MIDQFQFIGMSFICSLQF